MFFVFFAAHQTRYYMPKASVVREQYRMMMPPLSDLTVLGPIIMRECYWYDTFRLEKYVSGGMAGLLYHSFIVF